MKGKSSKVIQIIGGIVASVGFITFALSGMTFNFALIPVGFIMFFLGGVMLVIAGNMGAKRDSDINATTIRETFNKSFLENGKSETKSKCDYCGANYEGKSCPSCGAKKQ